MTRRDLGVVLKDVVDGHEPHRRSGARRSSASVLPLEIASWAGSFPRVRHLYKIVSNGLDGFELVS